MTDLLVLQAPFAKVPPPGPLQTLNHFGGVSAVTERRVNVGGVLSENPSPLKKPKDNEETFEELRATIGAQNEIIKEQSFIIESLRRELAQIKNASKPKPPTNLQKQTEPDSSFFWNLERLQGNIQEALSKYS